MYQPLPNEVTIKPSSIHGLGLFATAPIPGKTRIGISHVEFFGFPQGWSRTPLGGFINHSEDANCEKRIQTFYGEKVMSLYSFRDIEEGEELTCFYTLYTPPSLEGV